MNTCRTCKHWMRHNEMVRGHCDLTVFTSMDPNQDKFAYMPPSLHVSGGTVQFGQDYGCIHHESAHVQDSTIAGWRSTEKHEEPTDAV